MKVYKFGGASVKSAEGVRNLKNIISQEQSGLFIIVSAMGKTTNALEAVTENFIAGEKKIALGMLSRIRKAHTDITDELFRKGNIPGPVKALFAEVKEIITHQTPSENDYDTWYDAIVSYGELISTTIISEYLAAEGIANEWLDMRKCFITDSRHRDANVDIEKSEPLLRQLVYGNRCAGKPGCGGGNGKEIKESEGTAGTNGYPAAGKIFIGQGFIGASPDGEPTTLGREGSDYSAAAAAYMLDAESVTIWKDVEGILNADPKFFTETKLIPELTYLDAIELAYSGAQIIHPKTIKPLQNKDIPLYVKPFSDASGKGSVIKSEMAGRITVPILILKHNQVLVSIRPNDFSFVLEDRLAEIFRLFEENMVKINLIQSSAVNLSICTDRSRRLGSIVEKLRKDNFRVVYNDGLELLTIRGYTEELYNKYGNGKDVFLSQKTRRTVRIVKKQTRR